MDIKDRIIEQSTTLFFRYGIKSITMDDIAKELGISKKTIYQHFTDKDDVVYQVFEKDKCEYLQLEWMVNNVIEKMVRSMKMAEQSFKEVNPSLIHDLKKYHPRAWNLFLEYKQNFVLESTKQDLQKGIDEGLFRSDLQLEIIARLHLGLIEVGFDYQAFPPNRFSFIEVQLTFLDHFIRGIVSEKGLIAYLQYKEHIQ